MQIRQVVPRDAIPSVDDPTFGESYDGDDEDLVVAVEWAGRPRAYPVRYLHYHEIVNDVLDGETDGAASGDACGPIAVTWCPLCGSAVVYDRRHEGRTLEFGVSGKLADDDLVMYDRQTESEWKQSSGECIAGAFEGDALSVRPATLVPWREFRDSDGGVVLQPPGGASEAASDDDSPAPIEYDASPYQEYFEREGFGLAAHRDGAGGREWTREDDIDPKTVVLGLEFGGEALSFPLPRVQEAGGVVRATVGERDVVVFAGDDGIHAFADSGLDFEVTDGSVRGDGTVWNPATGTAADGRELRRLPARRLFAFAWQDDHGPDAFYPR